MARPKKEIDEEAVRRCAEFGMTYEEMADYFSCAKQTLVDRFQDTIKSGHSEMKESIRRKRLKIAMDDTHKQQASMLMFLSKVVLGEKEYEVVDSGKTPPSIKIEFVDGTK